MGSAAFWGNMGLLASLIIVGWVLVLLGAIVLGAAFLRRRATASPHAQERQQVPSAPTMRLSSSARGRGTLGTHARQERFQNSRQSQFPDSYPNDDEDYDPSFDRDPDLDRDKDPRKARKSGSQPAQELHGRREVLGLGAMVLGGATLWGVGRQQDNLNTKTLISDFPKLPLVPTLPKDVILNLYDFGAVGDGKADDGPALRRALDALRTRGGGTLYIPTGLYKCSAVPPSPDSKVTCCGRIPTNSRIVGAGAGNTIILLAPNSPNQTWMLTNYNLARPIDNNITVEHLTIDGNAPYQPKATDAQHGLVFVRAQGIMVHGVVFKNSYGLSSGKAGPSGTPAENFHTDCKGCADIVYSDCRIESDPNVPCGSGFSLNGSSRVMYTNCTATGLSHGQGYTHWQSREISYVSCRAYSLGQDGFHSEHSDMVSYIACVSGASWLANQGSWQNKVMTKGTSIGFNIYYGTHVQLAQCIGRGNVNYGAKIEQSSEVSIVGGVFSENVYGLRLQDAKSIAGTTLSVRPVLSGNSMGQIWYGGLITAISGKLNTPKLPGSGQSMNNPFPFTVTIYLSGGKLDGITLDGVDIGAQSGAISLRAGGSIKINYSSPPNWVWLAD